jgi:hypothetical protein
VLAGGPADRDRVVAQPLTRLQAHPHALPAGRLLAALATVASVTFLDTAWKLAVLAPGHTPALDTPTTLLRPLATLLVGVLAAAGVILLPRACVPGTLLVLGGVSSNVVSLVLWGAVPNPIALRLAFGTLHCNLADLCIWCGALAFLGAALVSLARMPAAQPA